MDTSARSGNGSGYDTCNGRSQWRRFSFILVLERLPGFISVLLVFLVGVKGSILNPSR
jgi:hypothetical protein